MLLVLDSLQYFDQKQRLHLHAQSGQRRPPDFSQAAQYLPVPAFLRDPLRRGRRAAILWQYHPALCRQVPEKH